MSGLQRARERGQVLGAVKKFTDTAIAEAVRLEGTYEKAAKRLGCSVPTIKRGMERVKKAPDASS